MNKMNVLLVIGLAIALVLGGMGAFRKNITQITENRPFGSVPVLNSPLCVEGFCTYTIIKPLNTATTTPCAIKSPTSTSTLIMAGVKLLTGTSSDATVWTLTKSATAFATTTRLQNRATLAAGTVGTILHFASSTIPVTGVNAADDAGAVDPLDVIAPSRFIVWGVQGTTPGSTSNLTGTCFAQFQAESIGGN